MGKCIPCGGCGARRNDDRCMGCLHDFQDGKSDWVKKYATNRKDE